MAVDFVFNFSESDAEFDFDLGEVIEGGDYSVYPGPYSVIPKVDAQTLSTEHMVCSDDIVVEAVPYLEVSNPEGGKTVTIAYL